MVLGTTETGQIIISASLLSDMNRREATISKRKLRSSYVTSIISISLVLFIIGIMGLFLLNANKISRHVKENIGFTVILDNNIREVDMIRIQIEPLSAKTGMKVCIAILIY